jgi:hypothetical protein
VRRNFVHRIARLEADSGRVDDGLFTFEELCRAMWRCDKKHFLKIAGDLRVGLFAAQFRREDAERDTSAGRAVRKCR